MTHTRYTDEEPTVDGVTIEDVAIDGVGLDDAVSDGVGFDGAVSDAVEGASSAEDAGRDGPVSEETGPEAPAAEGIGDDEAVGEDALVVKTATEIAPVLEAILIQTPEALSTSVLAEAVGAPEPVVEEALYDLVEFYREHDRGFELRFVAGGWRYWSRREYRDIIAAWVVSGVQGKLSQAALETLSVIAYLQPVSRQKVSAIRGVNVDSVVRTLMARGLIDESGLDSDTGARTLHTTDYFLERMGLGSLDDLPPLAPLLPEATDLEAELAKLADSGPATAIQPALNVDEEEKHD